MQRKAAVFVSPVHIYADGRAGEKPESIVFTSAAHTSFLFSGFKFGSAFRLDHLIVSDVAMQLRLLAGSKIDIIVTHVMRANVDAVAGWLQNTHEKKPDVCIVLDRGLLTEAPRFSAAKKVYIVDLFKAPLALGKMSKRWNEKGEMISSGKEMQYVNLPTGDTDPSPSGIFHISRR